ncbi:MAG: hypothetical protein IJJ33_00740 [Victivallales bacterium]|nr:hypothetical protein [Victivallales bacterium]
MKKAVLLILLLAILPLQAQEDSSAPNANQTPQSTVDPQLVYVLEGLPSRQTQWLMANLSKLRSSSSAIQVTLQTLSAGQKKHLQLYQQLRQLKLKGQYNQSKVFEPMFKSPAEFANNLSLNVAREMQRIQTAMEKAKETNPKANLQSYQTKLNYLILVRHCCDKITHAYQKRHTGNIRAAMIAYAFIETLQEQQNQKLPKRDWLTQLEAEKLMREIDSQRRKNKQNQQRHAPAAK